MMEYESKNVSPGGSAAILFGFLAAGWFIGALATIGIWAGMTGQSLLTMEKDMLNPKYVNASRIAQVAGVLIIFFLPAVATARLISRQPFRYLGFRQGFNAKQFLLVIAIILICLPLVGMLGELNKAIPIGKTLTAFFQKLEDKYNSQVEALAIMRSPAEFIFSMIIMALFPALFEETLFRGGLQQILIAWFKKPLLAITVTSIIFSIVHFSYYGFLPRLALGMVLGLIFFYSKSIWLNVTAHFVNNAFAITYMYYLYTHGKPVRDVTDDSVPVWIGVPALIIVVLLLRLFKQVSFKRNLNSIPPMDGPSIQSTLV
jgi:membrane protease YdiL (CAAX protease family)